jgi:ABC-type sulfate/molybdate transport systems ATPase subunit
MSVLSYCDVSGRRLTRFTAEVGSGEVVGVVGPRAAGKTELLRLAAGLARPRAGRSGATRGGRCSS